MGIGYGDMGTTATLRTVNAVTERAERTRRFEVNDCMGRSEQGSAIDS